MQDHKEMFVKLALDSWHAHVKRTSELIDGLTDDQLKNEVSPSRNTGTYLTGHLTAVHDRMLPMFFLGDQLYPQLNEPFLTSADKSGKEMPSLPELRTYWKTVNEKLEQGFNTMQPEDWFARHSSVSEEDFAKEPHRNRMNVLLSRTAHLANHLGQMIFLKSK